jgi:DNA-binding NarL/FixJ family response regulator
VTEKPIRVLLIDDHAMVLESISARLSLDPKIQVVGTARNCDDGFRVAMEQQPDVVLLDVNLPGRGAFDLAEDLVSRRPDLKLIFVTGYLADIYLEQALKLNASGYLMKGEPIHQLAHAIHKAVAGEKTFSQDALERLNYDPDTGRYSVKSKSQLSALTGRQIEVLKHLARGESVKEIAKLMHLSQKSVDSHKYRIMNKLGIHDRVELARFAIREGLSNPWNAVQ